MKIDIVPNFLTKDECVQLNNWTEEGVEKKWLDLGFSNGQKTDKRLTSRMYGERFTYPSIAYDILNRIKLHYGFTNLQTPNQGRDGIVVSYTKPTGDVYLHKDPREKGFATLRCNIVTQDAESGGKLFIEGNPVEFKAGDLHCYLASEHEHYITTVEGNIPRILWMFGFLIPTSQWE